MLHSCQPTSPIFSFFKEIVQLNGIFGDDKYQFLGEASN